MSTPDTSIQQQDFELRRQIMRRAIDRVWSTDLGETIPVGGFRLEQSPLLAQARVPARVTGAGKAPAGSVADLAARFRDGDLSPVEAARQALERAEAEQPRLNAFITLLPNRALAAARASEARFRDGQPLGPLDGVPVAVKDLIHMKGERTTSASKLMEDFVATEDAPVIRRLQEAGAVIIGKTNLHEFAYGGTGDVSYFGPCLNPRNPEHIPGGSSSGSAAAVAAGVCPMALGTDTGGSIRMPAAFCGIVGLKPTYARVSTAGVIPLSWSQDHVGPLAASVYDAAVSLAVLCDFEPLDLAAGLNRRWQIGVCRELFFQHLDADVRRLVEGAMSQLGDIHEVRIPSLQLGSAAQTILTAAEAGAFHHHWLETRAGDYDWRIRNRLEAGREASARDLLQAIRLRRVLIDEMATALDGLDVLAMPTMAVTAPRVGQREVQLEDGPADVTSLMVRNTAPMDFTGFPAISVPCGDAPNGLPVGLQLVARPWDEARLLQAAFAFEQRSAQ
jgi:aspartyl-tRNA(Asn)/glutamyl-tRNA(Gln) amidotransferase subunit A